MNFQTNLIVGPVSLIKQWEDEIRKKIARTHQLSIFLYHNKRTTVTDLLQHDIVLTTYGTLAQELNKLESYQKENGEKAQNMMNDPALQKLCPLLHPEKAKFYRVILDEAQFIKNKDTKTARACHKLQSQHRWCLTGTPMMNGVLELFSLVHFLRIRPYSTWDDFRMVSISCS
jgi:SNF2 family DNA or RNA helicase